MDTVLGLSITSTTVGWVLADATPSAAGPAGAVLAGEELSVAGSAGADAGSLSAYATAIVARLQPILTSGELLIRGIGVCWGADAGATAAVVVEILTGAGFDNVVPIRPGPADAALGGQLPAHRAALAAVSCPEVDCPVPEEIPDGLDICDATPARSAQLSYAGARAMLVAGAVTLVTSLSVVLSPHLGPAQPVSRVTAIPVAVQATGPAPAPQPVPPPLELPEAPTPMGSLWETPPAVAAPAPPAVVPQPSGPRSLLERVRDHLPHLPGH